MPPESQAVAFDRFKSRFKPDTECRDHLFRLRWPDGFVCPNCGHDQFYKVSNRIQLQCKSCYHQTSVTAGTLMHRTRIDLYKWFWSVFLISSDRDFQNPMKISGLLDLNYNSTKRITDKIQTALRNQDEFLLNLIQSFDAFHLTIKKEKHSQTSTKPTSSQNIPDGGSQILSSTSRQARVPSHKPAAEMGVTIPGYDLEELLCTGSNNLCYSGRRIEDHAPVFIKVALLKGLESAHTSFFHREYEMLQDLDIEGVVKPHRYHRYGDMEVLVYDDKVGLPLRSLIKNEPITLTTHMILVP